MDALLILGGLLLMVAGYIWVIVLAFGTGLLWGYGSLFPPVALAYIGVHWRTARKGVGLAALGCIPLVVGLALLASHDAARLEAILSLRWLKPEARPPAELAIALSGEFNGKPFAPQSGELIGGVLSLRQGHDFYAQRELQIRLPAQPLGALRLDVLPEDGGALPEVELSWLQPDQDLPEARRLLRGYTLHLDLRPKAPNRLEGEFHLSLPSDYRTTLSGHVELYTDRLRYRHGKVDLGYDSDDTLALVLRDYLQRRFASRDVSLVRAPSWRAASHARPLRIEALVAGQAQVLELTLEKNARRGGRCAATRSPPCRRSLRPWPRRRRRPSRRRCRRRVTPPSTWSWSRSNRSATASAWSRPLRYAGVSPRAVSPASTARGAW